jgi:hypothetical protein
VFVVGLRRAKSASVALERTLPGPPQGEGRAKVLIAEVCSTDFCHPLRGFFKTPAPAPKCNRGA